MSHFKVAVVIPFYKNSEPLLATLSGLSHQDVPAEIYEVIVVDDGETDAELPAIIKHRYAAINIRYLSYATNRGAAFARNYGWKNADAEIIVFLDGDQVVEADFVRQHAAFFEYVPDDMSVLQMGFRSEIPGEITNELNNVDLSGHPSSHAPLSRRVTGTDSRCAVHEIYSENMQSLQGAWHLCFSHNLSIPRKVLELTGGFDENIFKGWGLEDSEFAYNLAKHGVKIAYNPNVRVYHISHPLNWNSREGFEKWNNNLAAFINKHPDHSVIMQGIFRDFFDPVARQQRLDRGDPRPWLTCYTKFEASLRIACEDTVATSPSITLKNPELSDVFERLAADPRCALTVLTSRHNVPLIAALQTRSEARHVRLFTL